jgi:Carbamoyltransferase N-terminus
MIVLGINAYHGDVSAALLRDGELIAAVEEERFRQVKHWAGFPRESIRMCLKRVRGMVGAGGDADSQEAHLSGHCHLACARRHSGAPADAPECGST